MNPSPDKLAPENAELLSAYLDDALNAEERAAADALLAENPSAKQYLNELRALRQTLGELPREKAPATFLTDLKRRMLAEGLMDKGAGGAANAPAREPAPSASPEAAGKVHSMAGWRGRSGLWAAAAVVIAVAAATFILPKLLKEDPAQPNIQANTHEASPVAEAKKSSKAAGDEVDGLSEEAVFALMNDERALFAHQAAPLGLEETLVRASSQAPSLHISRIRLSATNTDSFINQFEVNSLAKPLGNGAGGGGASEESKLADDLEDADSAERGLTKTAPKENAVRRNARSEKSDERVSSDEAIQPDPSNSHSASPATISMDEDPIVGLVLDGNIEELALALADLGVTTLAPVAEVDTNLEELELERERSAGTMKKSMEAPEPELHSQLRKLNSIQRLRKSEVGEKRSDNANTWGGAPPAANNPKPLKEPAKKSGGVTNQADRGSGAAKKRDGAKDDAPQEGSVKSKAEVKEDKLREYDAKPDPNTLKSEAEAPSKAKTESEAPMPADEIAAMTREKLGASVAQTKNLKQSAVYKRLLSELRAMAKAKQDHSGDDQRLRIVVPVKR